MLRRIRRRVRRTLLLALVVGVAQAVIKRRVLGSREPVPPLATAPAQRLAPTLQAVAPPATAPAKPTSWVSPEPTGGCPDSHPVKANDSSKIFHVPGGLSYDRTRAERCYDCAASAEADGYRAAKR